MTPPQYRQVPAQVDLPALEHAVLDFWREQQGLRQSLEQSEGRPEWVFYEGPPTANGMPGAHHIEARVFKDVFPRFRTMQGYHVARKAGWDCHGLPVELAVEKELGFTGKQDIEAYGIAEFNARCRESVTRHTDAFAELTERMGYWVDLDDAYRTMDPEYIESVWWSLKEIFDKGLLVQDYRVAPWCPRCGTGLSDHELAQGYETVVDPSVYVRFPLDLRPAGRRGRAAGVDDDPVDAGLQHRGRRAPRRHLRRRDRRRRSSSSSPSRCWTRRSARAGRPPAQSFTGARDGALDLPAPVRAGRVPGAAHYVVNAEYVTTEDGTGLVHQSPAFGADDLAGLPRLRPAGGEPGPPGRHLRGGRAAGRRRLLQEGRRGARRGPRRPAACSSGTSPYEHSYPHCWRCHTALLYYAQPSWYIRTTADQGRAARRRTRRTNWFPDTVKHGRYGDWLNNNIDWALSRNRYWGTPLPIWRCEDDHLTCVGSLAELSELTGTDQSGPGPAPPVHRRGHLRLPADGCRWTATRVPEVIDAWYDSGSMPFAQWGYPYQNKELFEKRYPAQFISEAIDQTRGWFYTLMAVGTLVFDKSVVRERGLPRPHPRRGRPQDVQAPGQHPRADPADGPARRGRGALVHGRRRLAVGGAPGRATARSRRSSARRC